MIKRIFAFILVIVLLGLVIATFILGITGSKYFAGMLFLCIAVPILFWTMGLVARLLSAKGQELREEAARNIKPEEENKTD